MAETLDKTKVPDSAAISAAADRADAPEPITRMYRFAMGVTRPMAWWGRMKVEGAELIPRSGPLVVIGNHDSHWDPVLVGMAAIKRRQVRALAKASLWNNKLLAWVLNGMRQIPIVRGAGDAGALVNAVTVLKDGGCVGVFPEGTISRGKVLRARSGVGRLLLDAPETKVVLIAITDSSVFTKFPKRPRITVRFFEPGGGQPKPGEDPTELSVRMVAEIRAIVPPTDASRKPRNSEQPD